MVTKTKVSPNCDNWSKQNIESLKGFTFHQQVPPWIADTQQHGAPQQQGREHSHAGTPKHQALDGQPEQPRVATQ